MFYYETCMKPMTWIIAKINYSHVPQGPQFESHSYKQVFILLFFILLVITTKAQKSHLFSMGISLHQVNAHKLNTTDLPYT